MKTEGFGGTGNKKGVLEVYRPGEMTGDVEESVNYFLFPQKKFPDAIARRTEIHINDQYKNRSTVFIYFKQNRILATCRIISKRSPDEYLPIEASEVLDIIDQRFNPFLKTGSPFSIYSIPNTLPCCEIGGLRAADVIDGYKISIRDRYEALSTVLLESEKEALQQNYRIGFLTCLGTQNLQKLYKERFNFKEMAEVGYGDSTTWKALYRLR